MSDRTYSCRICGYRQDERPWSGEHGDVPSYSICSCCGAEFGVDDNTLEDVVRYRGEWLRQGLPWFEPTEEPDAWDIDDQLAQIPPGFHFSPAIREESTLREMCESGDCRLVKRARVDERVWLSVLEENFDRYGSIAAEATVLRGAVRQQLFDCDNPEILRKLAQRRDLTEHEREITGEYREG